MWIETTQQHRHTSRWRRAAAIALTGALALSGCARSDATRPEARPESTGTVLDRQFHGHKLREAAAGEAPSVALHVTADEHGGWNLHLRTKRFTFAPQRVNDRARAQEGHAHLYIGEQKYARLYSNWFHLPADATGPGEHQVLVTLNANDHTLWATDGKAITATATVTGSRDIHNGGHDHSAPADGAASPAGTR